MADLVGFVLFHKNIDDKEELQIELLDDKNGILPFVSRYR